MRAIEIARMGYAEIANLLLMALLTVNLCPFPPVGSFAIQPSMSSVRYRTRGPTLRY